MFRMTLEYDKTVTAFQLNRLSRKTNLLAGNIVFCGNPTDKEPLDL